MKKHIKIAAIYVIISGLILQVRAESSPLTSSNYNTPSEKDVIIKYQDQILAAAQVTYKNKRYQLLDNGQLALGTIIKNATESDSLKDELAFGDVAEQPNLNSLDEAPSASPDEVAALQIVKKMIMKIFNVFGV